MIATLTRPVGMVRVERDHILHLDRLVNPFAPSPAVREVLAQTRNQTSHFDRLESILVARLARYHQVSADNIVLAADALLLMGTLFASVAPVGSLRYYSPLDEQVHDLVRQSGCELVAGTDDPSFRVGDLDPFADASQYPNAYVMSPNDPFGSQLPLQQAVRLARSAARLIIDERHAGYAIRDHLPLFREFDNVVLVRSLEYWAGLKSFPLAYAIACPEVAAAIRDHSEPDAFEPLGLHAGIATLESCRYLDASTREIARERVNLIRSLRKLNMVQPMPSAANFVLVRLKRGERTDLRRHLQDRGIAVHYPSQPDLQDTIRVSAISRFATRSLTKALIDWAAGI